MSGCRAGPNRRQHAQHAARAPHAYSLVTVVFTKRITRPLFDSIAMTYRYEWRAMSYAVFLHQEYPPFAFTPLPVTTAEPGTRSSAPLIPSS